MTAGAVLEHVYTPRGARICGVDGCSRAHYAVGYCNPHWRRWKRNGDPGSPEIGAYGRGECEFDGCTLETSAKRLCATHYAQNRRGLQLAPIAHRTDATARDEQGRKQCTSCKQWLDLTEFKQQTRTADGLAPSCIWCHQSRLIVRRYGITLEQYRALLDAQDGGCAICGGTNASGRLLAVDHDHACCPGDAACGQCVRGLLCSNCNMAIGLFKDDAVRMRAAVEYISRTAARQ